MRHLFFCTIFLSLASIGLAQESEPASEVPAESEDSKSEMVEDAKEPAFERTVAEPQQKIEQESVAKPTPQSMEGEDQSVRSDDIDLDEDEGVRYYQNTYRRKRSRDRRNDIKTLTGGMSHSGGFGALSFRSTEYRGENMVLVGARGGWIINRTLAIGLEGHGIIPTTKYQDLNPTAGGEAKVLGGYGGLFLEPIFFSNEVVHITFPVSAGAGWMGYEEHFEDGRPTSGDLIADDVYWYAEPGVALEVNIARNFRLGFGVSKRFTQDLKLYNTAEDDFNTTNYFLTLKIGSF